jgi:uncharacterized protein (TIGR00730 family)
MRYDPDSRKNKHTRAYNNNTFLNSREARNIRVQCEMTEPGMRLKRLGVDHLVTFFGSARLGRANARHDSDYNDAYLLANQIGGWAADKDNIGICSGGGPGIMEAVNRGAHEANCKSVGMGISLPFEQDNNKYISPELDFEFHYFFTRKYWCVYLSKAFVIMPGGVGTLDELFEIITLIQTEKMRPRPIVLFNKTFWSNVINFDYMINHGTVSAKDKDLFIMTDSIDHAASHVINNMCI